MVVFDHIEVHVNDSEKYAKFLQNLFCHGRYKKISENNTYMFLGSSGIHIEIKESEKFINNFDNRSGIGFCMPCLRMAGAREHLNNIEGINFDSEIQNPDGECIFFTDYEGINWHFKNYDVQDIYINI